MNFPRMQKFVKLLSTDLKSVEILVSYCVILLLYSLSVNFEQEGKEPMETKTRWSGSKSQVAVRVIA